MKIAATLLLVSLLAAVLPAAVNATVTCPSSEWPEPSLPANNNGLVDEQLEGDAYDGNSQCDDLGFGFGVKFDMGCSAGAVHNLPFTKCDSDEEHTITIKCLSSLEAKITFYQPLAVNMKGANGGFLYDPIDASPSNPVTQTFIVNRRTNDGKKGKKGNQPAISHIEFCGQCNCGTFICIAFFGTTGSTWTHIPLLGFLRTPHVSKRRLYWQRRPSHQDAQGRIF